MIRHPEKRMTEGFRKNTILSRSFNTLRFIQDDESFSLFLFFSFSLLSSSLHHSLSYSQIILLLSYQKIMPEIIGPDGQKYYSSDHFDGAKNPKKKSSFKLDSITDYVYLVWGIVAILRWLWLLAELAIWLVLLLIGSTGINFWMTKHRK